MNVLFVCVANSGRSVIAERLFRATRRQPPPSALGGKRPGRGAAPAGGRGAAARSESTRVTTSRASSTRSCSRGRISPSRPAAKRSARSHRACAGSAGCSRTRRTCRLNGCARSATRSSTASSISSRSWTPERAGLTVDRGTASTAAGRGVAAGAEPVLDLFRRRRAVRCRRLVGRRLEHLQCRRCLRSGCRPPRPAGEAMSDAAFAPHACRLPA